MESQIFYNDLDDKGNRRPVLLNAREKKLAERLENELKNSLGFDISVTTLTTVIKKVTEQKFFEIAPADYLPIKVGQGAWSEKLTTYRSFNLADDFATGVINLGANNSRLANADASVDSLSITVRNWGKSMGWSLPELEMASKANSWDIVTAKEKARKKNWDLGIQRLAFLGINGDSSCLGLLTQSGITSNTSLIATPLSQMTPEDLSDGFCRQVLDAYRSNCNRTAMPSAFIVPESDYLGLAAPSSPGFPLKSKLQILEETFQIMTRNKGFKILPLAYGDVAYNVNELNKTRYVLLNQDEESVRMDIPVDYTSTMANSIDGFSFQNVGYGQFTGVLAYRPLEMLYLDR